jgi:hypothetical protein
MVITVLTECHVSFMKNSSKLILFLFVFISFNCTAQRINDASYINYYNSVVPTLNAMATTKTQYYGQNFSAFYTAILNNNLTIVSIGVGPKISNSRLNYELTLQFASDTMVCYGIDKGYQHPVIRITFTNAMPAEIKDMLLQYKGFWNTTYQQFFSNMVIESIAFGGTNGYNSPNRVPR